MVKKQLEKMSYLSWYTKYKKQFKVTRSSGKDYRIGEIRTFDKIRGVSRS